MKKLLILSAIIFTGAVAANADVDTAKTATIGVNVTDFRTIEITGGQNVSFTLNDETSYSAVASSDGLAANEQTAFKVVSRGGYVVKAGLQSNLENSNLTAVGTHTILGSKLRIKLNADPVASSGETAATGITDNTAFSNGGSIIDELVTSPAATGGTRGTTFAVAYNLNDFEGVVNLAVGTFTANVVYTIEAN